MDPVPIFLYCVVASIVFSTLHDIGKSCAAIRAGDAEYRAGLEFEEWRYANPGVYIGLSDEGKALVRAWIQALDWYARTHPWVDCTERRTYLLSLLDDLPPKSPESAPYDECHPDTRFLYIHFVYLPAYARN